MLQAGRFESITAARDGCPIKPHLAGNSVQKARNYGDQLNIAIGTKTANLKIRK